MGKNNSKSQSENISFSEETTRAVCHLARGIAHDLNNLLGTVSGYCELAIEETEKGKSPKRKLGLALEAANRAKEKVRQIQTFGRQKTSEAIPFDLNHAISETLPILKKTLPREFQVNLRLDPQIGTLTGDHTQIRLLLVKLATHARKTLGHPGEVLFTSTMLNEESLDFLPFQNRKSVKYALLKFSYPGIELTPQTIRHIFEPYHPLKETGGNTALNLALAWGITKAHGGEIFFSCPSEGKSIFSIYLPGVQLKENPVKQTRTKQNPATPKGKKVLWADTSSRTKQLAKQLLLTEGYELIDFADIEDAKSKYGEVWQEVSLVVLDYNLLEGKNREVIDALLKIDPQARIMLTCSYAAQENATTYLHQGVKDVLKKPFLKADLLSKIKILTED